VFSGTKVTLHQVLDSRELRVARQRAWTEHHALPLVSFTINMVGEVKNNQVSRTAFESGYHSILDVCRVEDISIARVETFDLVTGPELLLATGTVTPEQLKRAMVSIEQEHPLGRLFDIDVLDEQGAAVSRDTLGLPRRLCLICDKEAKICARSRAHTLDELQKKMSEMIDDSK
jgi:holo-ACP synthase